MRTCSVVRGPPNCLDSRDFMRDSSPSSLAWRPLTSSSMMPMVDRPLTLRRETERDGAVGATEAIECDGGGQQACWWYREFGEKVATRLRVEKRDALLLGRSRSGQDQKLLAARRRVKVGQKSRGSLLSYDERRSQSRPFGAAQACTSSPGQGGYSKLLGGGDPGLSANWGPPKTLKSGK